MPANQINARNERALKRQIDLYLRELEQNGNNLLAQHYDAANQLMQEAQPIINGPQPQERPAKRQRIMNKLKDGLSGIGIMTGVWLATSTSSIPLAAGAILFSGGLMTRCLQQAKQFENLHRRDDDDQPGAGNPGLAI